MCPLFLFKRSTHTMTRHYWPPCFQPCFWRWEHLLSEGPGLQNWAWLAAAASWVCSEIVLTKRRVLSDFSYLLQGRNCGPRVKSNDSFILPCFISESDMQVTRWARFPKRGIREAFAGSLILLPCRCTWHPLSENKAHSPWVSASLQRREHFHMGSQARDLRLHLGELS